MESNSPSDNAILDVHSCGCDLDGDIFMYNGKPVFINLKRIWHEGYEAGYLEGHDAYESE